MKNVFNLWMENDKKLPFKVRRFSWHPSSYFLVKEIKDINWDHYKEKGKLYGKAYGDMFLRGKLTDRNIQLNNAGTYKWKIVITVS